MVQKDTWEIIWFRWFCGHERGKALDGEEQENCWGDELIWPQTHEFENCCEWETGELLGDRRELM